MKNTFEVIDQFASKQWSLVTRQQLVDEKISRNEIASLMRSGALRRRGYRVYATVGAPETWEQRLLTRVLAGGPDAVASHGAGARLWQFLHLAERDLDVLVHAESPVASSTRTRSVHRTLILPSEDVTERSGIPCTSFERTLCDCTKLLTEYQLGRILDDGLRRGVASLDALVKCVARLDSGPGRKLSVVKTLLSQRDASFNPGGSGSELDVLKVIREAGLPEPVQQYPIRVSGHSYDLDYAWPDCKVFLEYYGLAVHSGASAVAHDSRRQTALVAAGWRPIVFTDSTTDSEMVRVLRAVLISTQSDSAVHGPMSA
jgi:hypothetical protein